jgi:long-subunit fatty acid transport protein
MIAARVNTLALVELLGIALFVVGAGAARANPIDAFGYGSRAAAMAQAATAAADDSSAGYYNPAALAQVGSLRIDLGYRYASPNLRIDGESHQVDAARGILVGLAAPGSIGPVRLAVGVLLSLPQQGLAQVKSRPYDDPRFVYYENRPQRFLGGFNLAVQLPWGLSLGGGLSLLSRTDANVALKGIVAVTHPEDSTLVSSINSSLASVRYPQAGLLWEATPRLKLGLAFRGESVLRLETSVRIDGNLQDPGYPPLVQNGYFEIHTHLVEMFQPWQLSLGLAFRATPRLLIAADLTYAHWSALPAPPPLTESLDIGVFNPLIHLPPPRDYPSPAFHDVLVPRLGAEWRAAEESDLALDLRGGTSFEPTPVPEQQGETNFADGNKLSFTAGAGLTAQKPWGLLAGAGSIDVHAGATWVMPRANHKVDPTQSNFLASGLVWQAGTMVRLKF